MPKIFEQQEDGSLKPIEQPVRLVKRLSVYKWLRDNGLSLEEIKFIFSLII
jgi:hypothetical protein